MKNLFAVIIIFLSSALQLSAQNKFDSSFFNKVVDSFYNNLNTSNYTKAFDLAQQNLEYVKQRPDNAGFAKAYECLGRISNMLHNYENAKTFFYEGLKYADKINDKKLTTNLYIDLSFSYTADDEPHKEKRVEYLQKVLLLNKGDKKIELKTGINIADFYYDNKDYVNTEKYLMPIVDITEQYGTDDDKFYLYYFLIKYYDVVKDSVKMNAYLNKEAVWEKTHDISPMGAKAKFYKRYAKYLHQQKKYSDAYIYMEKYSEETRKNSEAALTKELKAASVNIELDNYKNTIFKIEEENKTQKKVLSQAKTITILLIAVIIIIAILFLAFLRNYLFKKKTTRSLQVMNEELKFANEKAKESSHLKSQFISTITHELRTPLYGVVGISNILLQENKDSKYLKNLKFSADHLLALVNDLLQFSKIEHAELSTKNQSFSIADELNSIVSTLDVMSTNNGNTLHAYLDAKIPKKIIGDKLRLNQVLINIISNAIKFTHKGSIHISVTLEKKEINKAFILFKIKDTGVGIRQEDIKRIFEKFTQIDRKEGDYKGTGLGLPIAAELIKLLDSKINIESEIGKGTTFWFTIPFIIDDTVTIDESHAKLEITLNKILVLEDNQINQVVTKKILSNNNIQCVIVDDGYKALQLLKDNNDFDVVLMDLNMPVLDGYETTKLIRKINTKIPIIALTAFDRETVYEQAIAAGMNDVLVKPFKPEKLITTMQELKGSL